MTSLVYTVFHIATLHCSVRPEISPCTCETGKSMNHVELSCEKLESFNAVVDSLANKLNPDLNIELKITHSQLDDLEMRSFTDMNFNLYKLRMQWNELRSLPELPFRGLSNVTYLSVGDNELDEIPKHVLNHMPRLLTLDIGRCNIQAVQQEDFKGIQMVTNLILPSNNINRLDRGSFPLSLQILHLGRNQIESLNGSLHELDKLQSLFINANNISNLDGELPDGSILKLLMAHNNRLERLPANMAKMMNLETIHLHFNRLRSFDGVLKHAKYLNELYANNNELEYLAQDEFQMCELMETLHLDCNHIRSLNSSLHSMGKLKIANFSFNEIEEFSMEELHGLRSLKLLDLSNNRIQRLIPSRNSIKDLPLRDLHLDNNQIITLDSALAGLGNLRLLNLPHNKLKYILPSDFEGMHILELLDMTGNQLTELKPLENTILPSLRILKVAFNNITKLERDFHGLPVLCQVNLTNNQIMSISSELVSNTRCKNHNVAGKLEMYLDDNPIMCEVGLNEICRLMAAQDARIRGRSQCFENDQEVCTVLPMLYKIDLPLLVTQLNEKQMIVPSPILLPPIIATLGQPIINPVILAPPVTLEVTTTPAPIPSTTPAPPTPAASVAPSVLLAVELEKDLNETTITMPAITNPNTTTATTTSTTTTTTTAATTTTTTLLSQLGATEVVTTTAPTTTTTSTRTPKPNETLPVILDIEEPTNLTPNVADPNGNETAGLSPKEQQEQEDAVVSPVDVDEQRHEQAHERDHDHDHDSVAKTEYETVEYIPNLVQPAMAAPTPPPPSKMNLLEEDSDSVSNSVHEEYPHAAQSLQIPEEPPEE
ncbi:uncharacterized protein Dwil_GK17391 [Drosophila willistoni]|uniref:LRRCT domain-containing protein n=1 Tax=Drosophila willistoni TaxID=7260 RepID=B4MLU0_DROWI|nr:protein artichoke [Drosophila willistoni]EDW73151.1 uncharacterized protein Dwil_GK17391 [Drosophila willistoni]